MMEDHKNIWQDELKDQKGGFQMPENYLDDFESKMMNHISSKEEKKKSKLIHFQPVLVTVLSAAAMFMLAYFLFFNASSDLETEMQDLELSWDEYASFDESWIKEELAVLEVDETSDLDPDIDYLITQGVTTSEIIESYEFLP